MWSRLERAWAVRMSDRALALETAGEQPRSVGHEVLRAYLHWRDAQYDEAFLCLERADARMEEAPPVWAARAANVRGVTLLNLGRGGAALAAFQSQLTLAREARDPETEGLAHNDIGVLLVWDDPQRALLRFRMAYQVFQDAGEAQRANLGLAAFNLSVAHAELGQHERSDALLAQATGLVREARAWPYWVGTVSQQALRAAAAGNLDLARHLVTEIPADLPADSHDTLRFFAAKVEALHGDPARAITALEELSGWLAGRDDMRDDFLETQAYALERLGDFQEAARVLRALLACVRGRHGREQEMGLKVTETMHRTEETRRAAEQFWAEAETLRSLHREAAELSLRDDLTGLPNRRHFVTWSREHLHAGHRITLAFVDVDHFKAVNDAHGHDVGDAVLREVTALLRAHLGAGDLLARLGGDEFVAARVGADAAGLSRGLDVARRACEERDWAALGAEVPVTLSIGVAVAGAPLPEGLRRADQAMYAAKRAGRNQVRVWEEGTPA
ncbi:diguanylate cyclase (GGDEF)-like protein [Deinococcus sp. HSC-46F16]|uniref:diguanylate cyclase n=1 Tax=Deinococcus sp. HSC-46F16 TaxID=2910968 RepID=UPI0020A0ECCE|nr:diguanylate cyclase [Deinococcus sp. HSC-46F16]MCP2014615.1 diguanylate cyclase (GGDEF)-like protein [Deinococcus sp. HSC-46F16]